MMNEPQVSFITVCYNGFKDTCELIESLQTHVHSVSYEIIVVDNASREDEATKIKELYSDIVTLRSESNLGFSGGNNLGIRVAKGAYIFLINNDTYVESDGFHYLTERLESQKKHRSRLSEDTLCLSSAKHTVCRIHPPVGNHYTQRNDRFRLSGRRHVRHPAHDPLPAWGGTHGKT